MEISVQDFSKLFHDVEHMKYGFDCTDLDCCLTSRRLLILGEQESTDSSVSIKNKNKLKIKHKQIYYAVGGGKDGQSCDSTYCLPSQEEKAEADADVDKECIWCDMLQPYELINEGSYRCVESRRLLQAIRTVKELMKNKIILEKRIMLGMAEEFYIKVKGRGENYDTIATLLWNSDPDTIRYDESGCVNVEWKIHVACR